MPRAITVIIPARNEARDIAATITSLLAQLDVNVQVVAVNDHSTDETGTILDRLARFDPRVTVLHDVALRPGWFGKVNAMQHALERATGELILFTDADIDFEPRCLATAVEDFDSRQLDFLSLLPRFDCATFWENVYMPHSFIAGCVRFLPAGVNVQGSPEGAAAGAFMLVRRSVLGAVGDLQPVRQEMLDDICLARCIKRHGFNAQVRFAPQLLSVQMFKTNEHAFWGTTKNILAAVDQLWKAVPVMFLPLIVYWLPLTAAVLGIARGPWYLAAAGCGTYLLQAALIGLVLPISKLRWPQALLFPLSVLPVMCSMSVALYHRVVHRSVLWRGRLMPVTRS